MNEKGEEQPLKAGDFALVNPEGLTKENRSAEGGGLMSAANNPEGLTIVIPTKNTNTGTRETFLSS